MIAEYLLDCRVRNLSKRTIESYKSQLNVFYGYLRDVHGLNELSEVSKLHLKKFILNCQEEGKKETYINTILKAVKLFYKYMTNEYEVTNITKEIRLLKEPKLLLTTFSDTEVSNLIKFYNKKGFVNQRNKLIIEVMADTGLRAEEVRNLTNDNVKEGYFQFMGKGSKERVVKISPYLEQSLKRYRRTKAGYFNNLRNYREIDDFLFISKSGRRLKNNVLLEKVVKDACIATNVREEVQRKSCHSLRHYYAQKLLKNGVNLYTISRLLGHSNIKTTQTYLNSLSDSEILSSMELTPLQKLINEGVL